MFTAPKVNATVRLHTGNINGHTWPDEDKVRWYRIPYDYGTSKSMDFIRFRAWYRIADGETPCLTDYGDDKEVPANPGPYSEDDGSEAEKGGSVNVFFTKADFDKMFGTDIQNTLPKYGKDYVQDLNVTTVVDERWARNEFVFPVTAGWRSFKGIPDGDRCPLILVSPSADGEIYKFRFQYVSPDFPNFQTLWKNMLSDPSVEDKVKTPIKGLLAKA